MGYLVQTWVKALLIHAKAGMGSLPPATAHVSLSVTNRQDMSKELGGSLKDNAGLLPKTDTSRLHAHYEPGRRFLGVPIQIVAGAAYCAGK